MTLPLLLTAATLAAAVLGLRLWLKGSADQRTLRQRTALDLVEARADRLSNKLDLRLRRTRPGRWLRQRLDRAGSQTRTVDAALVLVALFLGSYLLLNQLISWWVSLLVAGLLSRLALTWFDRKEAQRREAFVAQLPEVARVLSNATSAGLALRSAIALTADEVAEPAASELTFLSDRLGVGASLEDALELFEEHLPSRELSLLTRTLIIQSRAGGQVATALQGISATLEARKDLRREIRTMLSGAVFTSWIVLFIGAGALLMLNLISPGTLDRMTSSFLGQAALFVAAGMYALGFILIRRQTRVDV